MKTIVCLTITLLAQNAFATLPYLLPSLPPQIERFFSAGIEDYQIGAEWGKKPVNATELNTKPWAFQRAAYATAKVGRGGTGFYLGKFGDAHVIATNHHVCPNGIACLNQQAQFVLLGKSYKMVKLFETFRDIDLTLLEIAVPASEEGVLQKFGKNFSFRDDVRVNQKLVTIGFGVANNPLSTLMANQDSDCVVLSPTSQYRHMKDPDDLNPGEDTVWSFANGCDVSHGDSGSAMVDRSNSNVVGIIWTGRIPKNPKVRQAEYMKQVQADPFHPDIWKEFSYAVPAIKMADYILKEAQTETDARTQAVLMKLLD